MQLFSNEFKNSLIFGNVDNALKQMKIYSDVTNPNRQNFFDKVISVYDGTIKPKECLVLAYAYLYKAAEYRPQAILYFERYLRNPIPVNRYNTVFLDVGKAYEAEYDFFNAERMYKNHIQKNPHSTVGYVVLARLYSKIDINMAVDYLETVYRTINKGDDIFSRYIKSELNNLLDKKEKGYVYKPRSSKAKNNPELESVKAQLKEDSNISSKTIVDFFKYSAIIIISVIVVLGILLFLLIIAIS